MACAWGVIPFVGAKQEALEELLDVDSVIYGSNRYCTVPAHETPAQRIEGIARGADTKWAVLRTPGEWGSPRGKTSS